MHSKKEILKNLNEYNYFIDENTLSNFIKDWKIEAIYEDEDGVEFFDNLAIAKLKRGISLKSQGYSNDEIIHYIGKILDETPKPVKSKLFSKKDKKEVETTEVQASIEESSDMKNVTLDVSTQTLQMLAETIADKITSQVKEQLLDADIKHPLLADSELSKKVSELEEENKKLTENLEKIHNSKFPVMINKEFFRRFFQL